MRAPPRVARSVLVPYVISRVLVVTALATIRHIITTAHLTPVPVQTHDGLLAKGGLYAELYRLQTTEG